MACLQIYRELLSLATFLRVHSNSKEVSYLSWQNTYPNLKTTCHIKLKFFLWTKLLENLLHAKYLISVAAPLLKLNAFRPATLLKRDSKTNVGNYCMIFPLLLVTLSGIKRISREWNVGDFNLYKGWNDCLKIYYKHLLNSSFLH